ncbi:MAG: PilC/PilY family type IV pilus protein, partial [bacterium]
MSGRWWTTAMLLAALPAVAGAQEVVKPEVMLLLDTSRAMSLAPNGQQPVCAPNGANDPVLGIPYRESRLNLVRDALIGQRRSFTNAPVPWCTVQDEAIRGAQQLLGRDEDFSYYRPMCCDSAAGDLCTSWGPCGDDHGRGLAFSDRVRSPWANRFVAQRHHPPLRQRCEVLSHDGGQPLGHRRRRPRPVLLRRRGAAGPRRLAPQLRASGGPAWATAPSSRAAGASGYGGADWAAAVDESADGVRRHNELVMWQARRTVPIGDVAPLSAMLADTIEYLQGRVAATTRPSSAAAGRARHPGRRDGIHGGQACPCAADAQCQQASASTRPASPTRRPRPTPPSSATRACPLRDQRGPRRHPRRPAGARDRPHRLAPRRPRRRPRLLPGGLLRDAQQVPRPGGRSALRGLRSRTKPIAIASTVADYCPENQIPCARPADAVVQWRINTFSEIDGGGIYGRVQATEMTCAAEGEDNGRDGAPHPTQTPKLYEEVLAAANATRRTLSTDPLEADSLFVVTGSAMPMFNGWGGLGGLYNVAKVEALTGQGADALQNGADGVAALPDHDPVGQLAMGLKLNGYFGDRGLPADRGEARRQLGALLEGDVVSLRTPDLGLELPSYQAYELTQRSRMSMVAAGARDGMIHVFRAHDGREVFNVVPRAAWGRMGESETPVDGPLDVADIVPCRTIGEGGPADCPSEPDNWKFQAWLVGGVGTGGANYFGVNMTKAMGLARDLDRPLDADQDFGRGAIWDTLSDDIANANIPPPPMGLAVSRPVLTHVRVRDQIKAAVIAGCGDDTFEGTAGLAMSDGAGRCVMVLDATTGALIRKFGFLDNFAMTYPFTGSPVAYPADGVAPADRAYIGDRQGRLWRMDLRAADPADWTIEIAFPLLVQGQVDPDQAIGYELGREVVDRPSLSLRADGGLVVVFGTGERSVAGGTGRSFMVSFTDRPRVDADGDVAFEVTPNWVMPLGNNERATGATIVRSETAYFTTRQAVEGDGCAEAVGRLYGIHSYFRYTDADGAPDTFQALGRPRPRRRAGPHPVRRQRRAPRPEGPLHHPARGPRGLWPRHHPHPLVRRRPGRQHRPHLEPRRRERRRPGRHPGRGRRQQLQARGRRERRRPRAPPPRPRLRPWPGRRVRPLPRLQARRHRRRRRHRRQPDPVPHGGHVLGQHLPELTGPAPGGPPGSAEQIPHHRQLAVVRHQLAHQLTPHPRLTHRRREGVERRLHQLPGRRLQPIGIGLDLGRILPDAPPIDGVEALAPREPQREVVVAIQDGRHDIVGRRQAGLVTIRVEQRPVLQVGVSVAHQHIEDHPPEEHPAILGREGVEQPPDRHQRVVRSAQIIAVLVLRMHPEGGRHLLHVHRRAVILPVEPSDDERLGHPLAGVCRQPLDGGRVDHLHVGHGEAHRARPQHGRQLRPGQGGVRSTRDLQDPLPPPAISGEDQPIGPIDRELQLHPREGVAQPQRPRGRRALADHRDDRSGLGRHGGDGPQHVAADRRQQPEGVVLRQPGRSGRPPSEGRALLGQQVGQPWRQRRQAPWPLQASVAQLQAHQRPRPPGEPRRLEGQQVALSPALGPLLLEPRERAAVQAKRDGTPAHGASPTMKSTDGPSSSSQRDRAWTICGRRRWRSTSRSSLAAFQRPPRARAIAVSEKPWLRMTSTSAARSQPSRAPTRSPSPGCSRRAARAPARPSGRTGSWLRLSPMASAGESSAPVSRWRGPRVARAASDRRVAAPRGLNFPPSSSGG